ncbi:Transcriptional regulator [Lachnellula hyalina]|uniref:Transcriptional regulator n=1 Tax=Lachnellula hyalina TaxID=1316788 RepID=A0A8H8R8H7_9HELO|nr:Transcriptional regulator [Lachnellula hyalina]TVY30380.1 Transcriptional regulator [Lachnellula hyalina]
MASSSASSNSNPIDPRLRDTAASAGAFAQRVANNLPTPIAAHPPPSRSTATGPPHQQYPAAFQPSPRPISYLPHTPQSGENAGSDHDGGPDDPKRSRACEACRGLKVRCELDPNNPQGDCKRCAKAGRTCIITVPSRKRQKKTDSRVAELEKKIDALTESLKAKSARNSDADENQGSFAQARPNPYQQVTNGGYNSPFASHPEARTNSTEWSSYSKAPEFETKKSSAPPMVMAGQKRKHADSPHFPNSPVPTPRAPVDGGKQQYAASELGGATVPVRKAQTHEYADVVDRGLLTSEMANVMFMCYVERMAPHMPAVVFPEGTTSAEVRKTKPTLFLAILASSAGMNYPELQRTLTKEVMNIYAERIIVNGEKTIELIQALHISTLWYWPPEHFEELKFYQLIHIAAVMAIDVGMGKKSKVNKGKLAGGLWRDHPWRRTPYPDPESPEARRSWMVCYFLCCNASMGLRRPNLIRWAPFMENCLEFFETSPDTLASDKLLCEWVRNQHISEEIGAQFAMDDPTAVVSIADSKVQFALKGFERDLEKWHGHIPNEARCAPLQIAHHVVNLYMHEVALHVDHNVDEFKPPFTEDVFRGDAVHATDALTAVQISALSSCLTAIDGIFETFLRFNVETIRCLPIFNFIRVAYAVVVLIKMYFAATTPNSELGKVIDKDNMKVEQYLDDLVEVFRAAAADEKSRPAAKFFMVLIMLKTWFHRQREGKVAHLSSPPRLASTLLTETAPETPGDAIPRQKGKAVQKNGQQSFSPTNTPLQLLSEVATGNSRGQADNGSQYPGGLNEWQQPGQGFDMNQFNMPPGYMAMPPNFDPSLGLDMGYTMGDNFEQAIGMSLGVGDFGYDDSFLGHLMDANGAGFDGFSS